MKTSLNFGFCGEMRNRFAKRSFLLAVSFFISLLTLAQGLLEYVTFYYAYEEKISLHAMADKAVVRLLPGDGSVNSFLSASGFGHLASQVEQVDSRTFIVTTLNLQYFMYSMMSRDEVHTVRPMYKIESGAELGVTNEFVVKFKEGVSQGQIDDINETYDVTVIKTTFSYMLLSVPVKGNAIATANIYQESGLVVFSHPNFITRFEKLYTPNDEYFSNQWYLHNTGQTVKK